MKYQFLLVSLIAIFTACAAKRQTVTTNTPSVKTAATSTALADGLSYEKAIVINATGEMQGIKEEYEWLKKTYPSYKMIQQSSGSYQNKQYDLMKFNTADGKAITVYFDITSFFGKF